MMLAKLICGSEFLVLAFALLSVSGLDPVVVISSLDLYNKTIVDEQNSYAGRPYRYSSQ